MLQQCKKDPLFKDKIRATYQACIIIDGVYVFIDRPNTLYDDREYGGKLYKKYKLNYAISTVVDPSKSASSISIESIPSIDDIEYPIVEDLWKINKIYYGIVINPKTCRPLYNIGNGKTWFDSWNEVYGGSKQLSLNKYVGDYTTQFLKYPSIAVICL